MNFFFSLLSGFIASSIFSYFSVPFYTENAKKTTHSLYLKISVNDIPQKGHKIVTNFYDKNEFKIKYKPIQFLDENIVKNDSKIEIQSTDKYIVADIVDHNTFSSRNELKNKLFLKVNEIEDNLLNPPEEVIPQFSIIEEDEEDNKNKTSTKLIYISDSINNAFKYNPKIKAQEAFFNASKENIKQVNSNFLPSIDLTASKGFSKVDSSSKTIIANENREPQEFAINLTQNLYSGGKISAEIKKAKNLYLIEEENLRLVKQEIILEASKVFLDLVEQIKLIELNNFKEKRFIKDLESIELLFQIGEASQSDLIFAKSQLVRITSEKVASINKLEAIEIKYKSIVGDSVSNAQLIMPNLKNINVPNDYHEIETIALRNNPKFRKLLLEEKISKNEIKSEFSEVLPSVTLDAEYSSSDDFSSKGSSSDTAEITAELTIPLFRGGKNLSKIQEAKLIAKKVRYDLENKKNETIQEVKNAWTNYKSAEINLKSAMINHEANKLILKGIQDETKLGMKSYIDLLKSKENLIDAEFEKIKANNQLIFATLELKANIGKLSLKNLDI